MVNTPPSLITAELDPQSEKMKYLAWKRASYNLFEVEFVLWQNRITMGSRLETAKNSYERLQSRIRNVMTYIGTTPAQICLVRDFVDEVICNLAVAAKYAESALHDSAEMALRKSSKPNSRSEKDPAVYGPLDWADMNMLVTKVTICAALEEFCAALYAPTRYKGTQIYTGGEALFLKREASLTQLLTAIKQYLQETETYTQSVLAEMARILGEYQ